MESYGSCGEYEQLDGVGAGKLLALLLLRGRQVFACVSAKRTEQLHHDEVGKLRLVTFDEVVNRTYSLQTLCVYQQNHLEASPVYDILIPILSSPCQAFQLSAQQSLSSHYQTPSINGLALNRSKLAKGSFAQPFLYYKSGRVLRNAEHYLSEIQLIIIINILSKY